MSRVRRSAMRLYAWLWRINDWIIWHLVGRWP